MLGFSQINFFFFKMFQLAILPNLAFDDERRRNLAEDDYRRQLNLILIFLKHHFVKVIRAESYLKTGLIF